MKLYDFYEEDVEFNKARVKMIASELRTLGEKHKINAELLKKMRTSIPWRFNW